MRDAVKAQRGKEDGVLILPGAGGKSAVRITGYPKLKPEGVQATQCGNTATASLMSRD